MTPENTVEDRPELHGVAAHVQPVDLERHDAIVTGETKFAEFGP